MYLSAAFRHNIKNLALDEGTVDSNRSGIPHDEPADRMKRTIIPDHRKITPVDCHDIRDFQDRMDETSD
jgi:hypothetical protein